ncbi:MAG: CHAT domain-containing protein, partial [Okeania sp. SIO2D1]|nr:CHAT domain-containing protein [Okeania sp. SIO2D1]
GVVYLDRIRGERANNLEMAIASFQAALEIYTCQAFPQDWAGTKNNLGNAYSNRIQGEGAENLEMAIASFQAALEIYTREAFPEKWAMTQNNLGSVYLNRIRGEGAENLEMAIASFQAALEIYTREAFPEKWAATQNNLGVAYLDRIRGERAKNLEIAIASHQAALEIYTREAFPEKWALTQNNLVNVYSSRIRGEEAENLEMAIASYQAALEIYTRQAFPEKWAATQNNLGIVYRNRIRGEEAENLEMAIAFYQAALEIFTRQAFPLDWAMTQNNLGNVYLDRIRGEGAENLEMAIASYQAALEIYTRQAFPEKWALTQNNLGVVYHHRIRGEEAENLEMSIICYKAALEIYTREAFPEKWAMTQNNLGIVYSDRTRGDGAENLEMAIASFQAALEIYTPSSFPLECLKTGPNLGDLAFEIENWEIAIFGYDQAISAVEQSRYWAVSELTKREIIENNLSIYEKMVQASINNQDYSQALLTVERAKSQTLIELLDSTDLYPKNATDEQKQRISELRRQISTYQQQLIPFTAENNYLSTLSIQGSSNNPTPETALRIQLQTANEQFQQLLEEIGDSDFTLTQQVTPQLPDFSQLLDSETAILEWYLPANNESNFYLFLITPTPDKNFQIHPLTFTPEDHQQLQEAIRDYRSDYGETTWESQLEKYLQILSQALHIPKILLQLTNYQRLILIPHRELHLIPFHALPISDSESQLLGDKFLVQYAPSCQILDNLSQRPPLDPHSPPFFAIQNPTQDLTYADLEVEQLCRQFDPQQILVLPHDKATKTALNQQKTRNFLGQTTYIHFSCHGEFDEEFPRNSYLRLANREKLTFLDIFENLDIPNCRLLILSACKMGLVETPPTDDYVGLASAFFYAGTRTVMGSLWEADDLATALLMIRLYLELPKFGSVVEALREAQYWLRNVSCEEVLAWLRGGLKLRENSLEECELYLELYDDDRPFANPIYWSAFTAIGI